VIAKREIEHIPIARREKSKNNHNAQNFIFL